jgi:hypothetical protein
MAVLQPALTFTADRENAPAKDQMVYLATYVQAVFHLTATVAASIKILKVAFGLKEFWRNFSIFPPKLLQSKEP